MCMYRFLISGQNQCASERATALEAGRVQWDPSKSHFTFLICEMGTIVLHRLSWRTSDNKWKEPGIARIQYMLTVIFISFCTPHWTSNRRILFMLHVTLFPRGHATSDRRDLTHFWLLHIVPQNGNAIVCLTISGLFRLFPIFWYYKQCYKGPFYACFIGSMCKCYYR